MTQETRNLRAVPSDEPEAPPDSGPEAKPAAAPKASRRRPLIFAAIGAVLATAGTAYYFYSHQFEETDDAQIDGDIANISPRVAGTVKSVYVRDNQTVKAGELLAEVDPSDLEVAVAAARAGVAEAEAQLKAEDPSVSITETSNEAALANAVSDIASTQAALAGARKEVDQLSAQLAEAEANNRTAQLEKERSDKLIAQGAISQADSDVRRNAAAAAEANVDALQHALAAARDRVSQQQAHLTASQSRLSEVRSNAPRQVETRRASVLIRQANLDLAKAQLAQAELNLSYAKIISPAAGIVGKKSISVGDRVAPGQQIMAISQIDSLWVTANYRETQLGRIHPGQPADIHVDALDTNIHGTVESVAGATGSRFSLLPPENATGNYVKVVQRIPVRIKLDPGQPSLDGLRPGMSVEPKVRVE